MAAAAEKTEDKPISVLFYNPSTPIDIISIHHSALAVYPQRLLYGICEVDAYTNVFFCEKKSFVISQIDFIELLRVFLKVTIRVKDFYKELEQAKAEEENILFENSSKVFNIGPKITTLMIENNSMFWLLHTETFLHRLEQSDIFLFYKALQDLLIKSFCYPRTITYTLKKFLHLCDEQTLVLPINENKVTETLLQIPNVAIDTLQAIELLERHSSLFILMKKLIVAFEGS